jgi:two-component sensor histidine kinase
MPEETETMTAMHEMHINSMKYGSEEQEKLRRWSRDTNRFLSSFRK